VDRSRLWAGRLATALVATLTAMVGILPAPDLFDVSVPARPAGITLRRALVSLDDSAPE